MRLAGSLVCVLLLLLGAGALKAQSDAWLGVKLEVVEQADAKKLGIDGGLKVTRVDAKSPAADAGLAIGDIILSAGEDSITSIEQMGKIMGAKQPGDMLSLGVRRANGRNEPLMVTLGSAKDKDDKFGDDAKVKELRERLRELDAERRRVRDQLDERLKELGSGKADKETTPAPKEDPAKPEPKPAETHEPQRVRLKVTLGATFVNLEPEESAKLGIEGGIRVTVVSEGSAAAEAGLKVDDVVASIGGEAVAGTGDLRTILADHNPGDRLEFEVVRAGKRLKISVVLRARDAQR